jgi:flagellar motor switch protein FliN/FliY
LSDKIDQNEIDMMLKAARQSQAIEQAPEPVPPPEKQKGPVVEKVEFAPFKPQSQVLAEHKKDLNFFNYIPLVISGELGKAHLTVRELLKLEEGSVVKLDKMAGESATVLINGQFLGLAEIVVINDRFGLRVTAIGSPDQQEEKEEKSEMVSLPENQEKQEPQDG